MDSREDWRCCKWDEANCIRELNKYRMYSVLGSSACVWMKEWTLFGKIHLHKVVTGQLDKLPSDWTTWYTNSWKEFLETDPECVRVKKICDYYGIGVKN
jgi:hypothetical protein